MTYSYQYPTSGGVDAGEYMPGVPRFVRDPSSRVLLPDYQRSDGQWSDYELAPNKTRREKTLVKHWSFNRGLAFTMTEPSGNGGKTTTFLARSGDRVATGVGYSENPEVGRRVRRKWWIRARCSCGRLSWVSLHDWNRDHNKACIKCGRKRSRKHNGPMVTPSDKTLPLPRSITG